MYKKETMIGIQVFLLISMSFAFSYIFSEAMIVSAQESVSTCLVGKNGEICQQYSSSECNNKCLDSCIPTSREQVSECKIGSCFAPEEGTCSSGSTKKECLNGGGKWIDDLYANSKECKKGCCLFNDEAIFTTERSCSYQGEKLGAEVDFRAEVNTELECLILAKTQEEGACVFESGFEGEKNDCKFITKANCLSNGGEFYSGYLCSYPDFNTKCEKQSTTSCIEGKDEVYWVDSCGNKENIYSAKKSESWNNGKVLSKSESCELGTDRNLLINQGSCGNCFYLTGSICGQKTTSEKLSDSTQDFVCRDLSCKDSEGKIRENGESWCVYQGAIGVDSGAGSGGKLRSVDTPGSRHFREVCMDGEVRIEPCADYRNEICIESQIKKDRGGTFSSSACRVNRWQECYEYNSGVDKSKASKEGRDNKCEQNPDCFVKEINVDDNFKFNICAPKYPPGFDLRTNGEGAEQLCSLATQKCTVVYVKKTSGWKCEANCDCEDAEFTRQMNDLCMSLGDCGASVNYIGDLSEDYKVKGADKLGKKYLSEISEYSTPIKGQYAKSGNLSGFNEALGIPDGLGGVNENIGVKVALTSPGMIGAGLSILVQTKTGANFVNSLFGKIGLGAGSGGAVASGSGAEGGLQAMEVFSGAEGAVGGGTGESAGLFDKTLGQIPGIESMANVLGAALALYSVYSMFKMGFDLGDTGAIAITAIAVAGTVAIYNGVFASSGFQTIFGLGFWPGLGIAMLVVMIVFKLMGIGDIKKKVVQFSCEPWQAPFGGDKCSRCGGDGLLCSKYSCQSLGQTCEFINEGSGNEECVNINPNDVTPPNIKPLESVLSESYEHTNINDNGWKIEGIGSEECVGAYEELTFGVELDEPGQCRLDTIHTSLYEDMEFSFGGSNLLLWNHTQVFSVPSLESLGIPGYNPMSRADYSLYVRCKDANGNSNIKEKVIGFCVKPGIDSTPPYVKAREPILEWVEYGATELNASVYTNEPSECKWSSSDKDYNIMENEFSCENDVEDQTPFGWKCDTKFNLGSSDETFYVRCKDQPWLIEDDGTGSGGSVIRIDEGGGNYREIKLDEKRTRNTNTESYKFIVKKSSGVLKIDSITPDNNEILEFGVEPASVLVVVKTSGGVNGNAECSYKWGENYITFRNTLEREHKQVFQSFDKGKKIIQIRCKDIAGNAVEDVSEFEVKIDAKSPYVTRVYDSYGELVVVTDEPALCGYVIDGKCNFDFEDEEVFMMDGNELVHTSSFDDGVYSIKCKDEFGNKPGGCSVEVRSGI